jgi:hypothetical protein
MHGPWGQSFRFRKDLGLPNQVCLFRQREYTTAAAGETRHLCMSHVRILYSFWPTLVARGVQVIGKR